MQAPENIYNPSRHAVIEGNFERSEPTYYNLEDPQASPFYQPSNRSFGSFLRNIIYPAYHHNPGYLSKKYQLEGTFTIPEGSNIKDYHLLTFGGNGSIASDVLDNAKEFATKAKLIVHEINLPGIGFSDGRMTNHTHAIEGAILQVQYLINHGVDPEKIILCGHSLGGAIATITAAHFHSKGQRVSVFNNRSFSTLSSTVNGMMLSTPPITVIVGILMTALSLTASVCYRNYKTGFTVKPNLPFAVKLLPILLLGLNAGIKLTLKATNWEMNAGNAYLSIPDAYKRVAYAPNDCVITNWGGLYRVARSGSEFVNRSIYEPQGYKVNGRGNNHCVGMGHMIDSDGISMENNLGLFTKEIQLRNVIKDLIRDDLNRNFDNKNSKIALSDQFEEILDLSALSKIEKQIKALRETLTKRFEAERDMYRLTKVVRSTYRCAAGVTKTLIGTVYNVHSGIGTDSYLKDKESVKAKFVEVSAEIILEAMGRDKIMQFNVEKCRKSSNDSKSSSRL